MGIESYKDAGVDIEKGDAFAAFIGKMTSPAVSSAIGGFAGGLELDLGAYTQPVLFSSTDGVGTKLMVAKHMQDYSTIGIDLVAMCVNDLAVCGATPLVFLDYIACGKLNQPRLEEILRGIVRGCEEAGCTLAGGETAEMPDMYGDDDIDLAGFCTGIAEKREILPKIPDMKQGDVVLGLPSRGIHSNGLSLARKIIPEDSPHYPALLHPTKIYVRELIQLISTGKILGAAHITGGGLEGNLSRVLPKGSGLKLYWDWPVPKIFTAIRENCKIPEEELRRVFNMGIGAALVVHKENSNSVIRFGKDRDIPILEIGELV